MHSDIFSSCAEVRRQPTSSDMLFHGLLHVPPDRRMFNLFTALLMKTIQPASRQPMSKIKVSVLTLVSCFSSPIFRSAKFRSFLITHPPLKSDKNINHSFCNMVFNLFESNEQESEVNRVKVDDNESQPIVSIERQDSCDHLCRDDYQNMGLPFPPSLPTPKSSFHKRELPSNLIQFSSKEGKKLFTNSLVSDMANAYFPLSEQFLSQSDPAYCGVATLIMILNAMGIDPKIVWKGAWRWFGSEEMILEKCCINTERVKRAGILMEEFCSLAECQGLRVDLKRPCAPSQGDELNPCHTLYNFRKDVINATKNPPSSGENGVEGAFLVVAYSRSSLGQTGGGHFSPVAAYSKETDKCLILDVARFKYPPYWVSIEELYEALRPEDVVTHKSRGWFMMYPPNNSKK